MNNIKKIRKGLNMTQREFAKLCGVSYGYIFQVEKGLTPVSSKIAERIANKLNITTDEIYGSQSIKNATRLSTSLINLVSYFKNKPKDRNNDFLEELEERLLLLLENLTNINSIDYEGFEVLILIAQLFIEKNENISLFAPNCVTEPCDNQDKEKISIRQKIAIESFNSKIDKIKDFLDFFKVEV